MCDAHLFDGPLICIRPDDGHQPHKGCKYESTYGVPHAPKEEM